MEIDHIRPQRKCFLCGKGGIWQNTVSLPISFSFCLTYCITRAKFYIFSKYRINSVGSVNAIAQERKPETGEVHCWTCGEVGHLKRNCPKNSRYQYQQHTRDKNSYQGQQSKNQGN